MRARVASLPALCWLGCALAATPPPSANPPDLSGLERQRRASLAAEQNAEAAASAQRARLSALSADRQSATERLRKLETAEADAADRMAELAGQLRAAQAGLAQQEQNLGPLLPVIEHLALEPDEILLALPAPPSEAAQGLAVLHGITTSMASQARHLRARQAHIAALTDAMRRQAPVLTAAEQDATAQAAQLDQQISGTRATLTTAESMARAAAREAAATAARETSLRAAIAAIEAARARAAQAAARRLREASRSHHATAEAAARAAVKAVAEGPGLAGGSRHAPVAGRVVLAFGATTASGPAQGIRYAPPPSASVVSPCTGTVLFAGPFRSYGRVMILDCGHGYVFVLAGLDRHGATVGATVGAAVGATVGATVQAGDPVGMMPGWDPTHATLRPLLYVQLRHDGTVIDPAPFLSARR